MAEQNKYTDKRAPKDLKDIHNEVSDDFTETEIRSRRKQFTIAVLVLLVSLIALGLRIRGHRHLTQLKSELRSHATPQVAPAPQQIHPGGQDPLVMTRSALSGSEVPEFLSATLLPGRGMQVFQITAAIPGMGEVPLLDSPPLESAAPAMTGSGSDLNGQTSTSLGAAFTLPWAGRIAGSSSDQNTIQTEWHGRTLNLPAVQNDLGRFAIPGLMLNRPSDSVTHSVMPDGGLNQANFIFGNFDGRWPSQTQGSVAVLLSGHTIDLTVAATNNGSVPEPIGIGWQPHFLLAGNRRLTRLHLPTGLRVEELATGKPTGKLLPVEGTAYDFTDRGGAALGDHGIDAAFVHLRAGLLDSGPVIELIQPDQGYGLRITALTSNIRSFRIVAPSGQRYISIQPNFNYEDPFGREWPSDENTGMVTLDPGQTTTWKVRLEIFSPSSKDSPVAGTRFDPPR